MERKDFKPVETMTLKMRECFNSIPYVKASLVCQAEASLLQCEVANLNQSNLYGMV